MKILKQILLILILALTVSACEDEATNPDDQNNKGITKCIYTLVTEHESYYRQNSVVDLPTFNYNFHLIVKLDDSLKPEDHDSLTITSGSHKYIYKKAALTHIFSETYDEYAFSLLYKSNALSCDSVINWTIKLYDNTNHITYDYVLAIDFSKSIRSHAPFTKWDSPSVLSLGINNFNDNIDKIKVTYLASNNEAISTTEYLYNSDGIKVNDVPANAAYYSYTVDDELSGIQRHFTSLKYTMPDKPSGNIKEN